jgi:hypothetical protein
LNTGGLPKLIHHAAGPVSLDRSRRYEQDHRVGPFGKPSGLWVSVSGDDGWAAWCSDQNYRLDQLSTAHRVTLRARADVRFISDVSALDAFDSEFRGGTNGSGIDWATVASCHDGMIIAPYQWGRRSQLDWYYGWDCASGCIWNLDAIESFDLLP